ncbi:hypothetical protein M422DRAFT_43597 [Sphaerobolus stellatus SS14]|nr:hypothetical protein M422DRAFT_43597 [Sphaerobolus stellatus SS14]
MQNKIAPRLIPAFEYGQTEDFLCAGSIEHSEKEDDCDYNHFSVNRFVDQDMFMRCLGGGIGYTIHYCMDESIAREKMDVSDEMDDPTETEEEVDWGIEQLPLTEEDGKEEAILEEDIEEDSADDVEEDGTDAVEELDMEDGVSEASEEGFDAYDDP